MNIKNLLELLNENKSIIILVPNKYEKRLLYDRIRLYDTPNVELIDDSTIKIDASIVKVLCPETLIPFHKANTIVVEFSDSIPKSILGKLESKNLIFSREEIC